MINRYTRPAMAKIWSDESRYHRWLKIEILACEARAESGLIPMSAVAKIRQNATIYLDRIREIEEITKHDVIAFVSAVGETIGDEACYLHQGLTSSDVLDTCLATQCVDSIELIMSEIENLIHTLKRTAVKHKYTPMIGRTHGIHAEPITFGLKVGVWYQEFERAKQRLNIACTEIAVGKLSGAVGNLAHLQPAVEEYVMQKLNLSPEPIATQVVQRDRHAFLLQILALIASSAEKIAIEIRHLQRSEVRELEEPFSKGQKGSSAMPHKRNPILCENISGLARLVKNNAFAAYENIPLWHERDISHSSVERVIIPDTFIALDFLLSRLHKVLNGLTVNSDRMMENLESLHGLIFSQKVLILLTEKNLSRDDAYRLVQRNAMKTWKEGSDFRKNLLDDGEVREHLTEEDLHQVFDLSSYFSHVDYLFRRAQLADSEMKDAN